MPQTDRGAAGGFRLASPAPRIGEVGSCAVRLPPVFATRDRRGFGIRPPQSTPGDFPSARWPDPQASSGNFDEGSAGRSGMPSATFSCRGYITFGRM